MKKERKYNITSKQLKKLGFKKVKVTPEEAGDVKGFYYYTYDFIDNLVNSLGLITNSNDDRYKGKYWTVVIFNYDDIEFTSVNDLREFIKIVNKNLKK